VISSAVPTAINLGFLDRDNNRMLRYNIMPLRYMGEVNGQLHTPAALPLGERGTDTHWIRVWVGPRVGMDAVEKRKFLPLLEVLLRKDKASGS
jgi:hypothetical protein